MNGVIDQALAEINSLSQTDDPALVSAANELAAGVTAEREAEIAEALPVPYTMLQSSTADIHGAKIRVPRMVRVIGHKLPGGDWVTSTSGRKLGLEKADCAVGLHTVVANDYATVVNLVVLWRRVR